jgi:hypothetical protein
MARFQRQFDEFSCTSPCNMCILIEELKTGKRNLLFHMGRCCMLSLQFISEAPTLSKH